MTNAARRLQELTRPDPDGKAVVRSKDADGPAPRLPHEADQSTGRAAVPPVDDGRIAQAGRDLAQGQVDTDLRGTPGLDAERRRQLLLPRKS
jgi:hypothetical protein